MIKRNWLFLATWMVLASCAVPFNGRLSYKVVFNLNYEGATGAPATQTVSQGAKATKPSDPSRTSYSFNGWYRESTCATVWNFDSDTVNSYIILYAKWTATSSPATPNFSVVFNLNYDGATGAPAAQTVSQGAKATKPSEPSRASYYFNGWYRESTGTTVWNFDSDTVSSNIILYAKWTALSPPTNPNIDSVEFGADATQPISLDQCTYAEAPKGGTLFSVWTKVPDGRGIVTHNIDVYVLKSANWRMRCIVGNLNYPTDPKAGVLYNANSMLFVDDTYDIWAGDYSYYQTADADAMTEATVTGWVWAAWQVIVNTDSITIRQWLKFGLDGELIYRESTPTFKEIRDFLGVYANNEYYYNNNLMWSSDKIAAWTPSDAVSFQVGKENVYLCHARMDKMSTKPTDAELNAIARDMALHSAAWADYELNWTNGAPNLTDRSGNSRDLTLTSGGTLYKGAVGPAF
jgi:uncharacterized repeat protein (TIGR02543 family)